MNLYAFCANNPVMYYDPSGHGCDNPEQNEQPITPAGQVGDKSGNSSKFKWGNPKSTPTYGHTFSQHGKKQTTQQLIDRANEFENPHQVGQWLDDQQAADFLADVVKNREGVFDVQLSSDIKARSILPDGTEVIPDMVKVVMKPDGSIRTAYPYSSLYPNS